MKTDGNIKVVSGEEGAETILVLKEKKFPWWIFLLLIPLILLIPISRTVRLNVFEEGSNISISNANVKFAYPEIGMFGKRIPVSQNKETDQEGKVVFECASEPLWYFLFDFICSDSAYISVSNQCFALDNKAYLYNKISRVGYFDVPVLAIIENVPIYVVDKDNGNPLSDAKVEINIDNKIDSLMSNEEGIVYLQLPKCGQGNITLIGSKEAYENDTLITTISDLVQMPDTSRRLKLDPFLKGEGGDLRFNLQWYSKTDLDLHVIDPCGNEIYYERREFDCGEGSGTLDVDANAKYDNKPLVLVDDPQENIFFIKPSKGEYIVKVMCFQMRENDRRATEVNFNLTIIDKHGRKDFEGKVKDRKTVEVTRFVVE
ncbi:MAG: hypothetical protein MJ211_13385 [Bacteroidales bacterium]|nr:hypothetical protein [Bacteroidales bacterium]